MGVTGRFRVWGFRVRGLGCRVYSLEFLGLGFKDLGFWGLGLWVWCGGISLTGGMQGLFSSNCLGSGAEVWSVSVGVRGLGGGLDTTSPMCRGL